MAEYFLNLEFEVNVFLKRIIVLVYKHEVISTKLERKLIISTNWLTAQIMRETIYATSTFPIMHLICLPKFCTTFVFHFSRVLQPSQEKLKTKVMQNFGRGGGGQIRCIMGNVEVAYREPTLLFVNCKLISNERWKFTCSLLRSKVKWKLFNDAKRCCVGALSVNFTMLYFTWFVSHFTVGVTRLYIVSGHCWLLIIIGSLSRTNYSTVN